MMQTIEKSSCGVGFIASRNQESSHELVVRILQALQKQEHRGACSIDMKTSDGAGIMTDIPFELLGYKKGEIAIAMLFASTDKVVRKKSLDILENIFDFYDLKILSYREVPVNIQVLGEQALARMPYILQVIIQRPEHCRTDASFEKLLYTAKQMVRVKLRQKNVQEIFFASFSSKTIVYKALTTAVDLDKFYLDLQNPVYKSRFGIFHRRFSTNTTSTWDKAQPFRLIGHNGEFNTITGNRSWSISREKAMGLYDGELLTEKGVSDSGSLNEMVEALLYRSSIPYIDEVLAIMMPPANQDNNFYKFWSRAMEAWDGPALIVYGDGQNIGARLDRNGFRPCRWAITQDFFYLGSEAGSFSLNEADILSKGTLQAGHGLRLNLQSGKIHFTDPSQSRYNFDAKFNPRTFPLHYLNTLSERPHFLHKKNLFLVTEEEMTKILIPMIETGKEPIGSMGDTARLAVFSEEVRSLFDYFYHNFAQVTNPPLDYLREKHVTDLTTYLGRKPNIFAKKEMIPAPVALELESPILSLGQMTYLQQLTTFNRDEARIIARSYDITFDINTWVQGCQEKLQHLCEQIRQDVEQGVSIVILTDQQADYQNIPIPCLLALRIVTDFMRNSGLRLKFSMVLHSGQLRTTHHIATSICAGAAAVCPYLALEIARFEPARALKSISADIKEKQLIKTYESGLLKIMAKMGISVVRSYQSSLLLTSVGISESLINQYFQGVTPLLGGIGFEQIIENSIAHIQKACTEEQNDKLLHTYQFREHNKGTEGEKHAMTNTISRIVHQLVREKDLSLDNMDLYKAYLQANQENSPVHLRHLFQFKPASQTISDLTISLEEILSTFGSGAMSFGAISAEAQRDIFLAMKTIGGRSNSGEGGENPFYYTDGITAHIKQIASGRFGVNALYLIAGNEIQIKIAQGAKPGEGGQLMSVKVDEHIAKARNSLVNVDLISPPPMHDIYSIEDLKQLIYELKQLHPKAKVSVKLVSGAGIGTIAVGVAKAGADIIHISGGDGGTGAASLSSMKHAGLPWEFGLWEVHQTLLENNLRHIVTLRVDGGLQTGRDIIVAAILGAEEFDFGKLLLVAQGCVMARICEKNTCPTGIATHDPRFKAKYKGTSEQIVQMLTYIAEDIKRHLEHTGYSSLKALIGRTDLLEIKPEHTNLIQQKHIDLSFILNQQAVYDITQQTDNPFNEPVSALNEQILCDSTLALQNNMDAHLVYPIHSTDRAVLATLSGAIALKKHIQPKVFSATLHFLFQGSAGQGFGAFMTEHIQVTLLGEANDSVAKSMSGGKMIIRPAQEASFKAVENVIIGNCALYGATGGILYVNGIAGDRFAVRNSGALAIVEGTGLHACEYMTKGKVIILGETSHNIGGGMTGGEVIIFGNKEDYTNQDYITHIPLNYDELEELQKLLIDYYQATESHHAMEILSNWIINKHLFKRYLPVGMTQKMLLAV